ncbi:uncharacterized protein RCC_04468 [Ramularia collo-cygni]|uniref:DUF6590 domain-containing protein n=1 Tax=Ramularia collo-cygni TaxID=112498 RepID=A0A2D3V7T1_9PEZI|nr:uncharacterized protein RCC_04468 [Ramularia collo-cygni]CZT18624.1 uncharacterized protein RCC_04468 [Ramularia collo-cygni]
MGFDSPNSSNDSRSSGRSIQSRITAGPPPVFGTLVPVAPSTSTAGGGNGAPQPTSDPFTTNPGPSSQANNLQASTQDPAPQQVDDSVVQGDQTGALSNSSGAYIPPHLRTGTQSRTQDSVQASHPPPNGRNNRRPRGRRQPWGDRGGHGPNNPRGTGSTDVNNGFTRNPFPVRDPGNSPFTANSTWDRNRFLKGDVISIPYHEPNVDPNLTLNDEPGKTCLRSTNQGYVFTKRRMFVILYKHKQIMVCLPLTSKGSRGLASIPTPFRNESVCLWDRGAPDYESFEPQGQYSPIEFNKLSRNSDSLGSDTTINLTKVVSASWQLDMWHVGRLTRLGYNRIMRYRKVLVDAAEAEAPLWLERDGPATTP